MSKYFLKPMYAFISITSFDLPYVFEWYIILAPGSEQLPGN